MPVNGHEWSYIFYDDSWTLMGIRVIKRVQIA